jgi:hypothetical protein
MASCTLQIPSKSDACLDGIARTLANVVAARQVLVGGDGSVLLPIAESSFASPARDHRRLRLVLQWTWCRRKSYVQPMKLPLR